ncbi:MULTISPECIES: FeoC-like transcriptional regulator [Brenneria]|uniref:Transcriptional regulator HTH-type FeoC domain-containing protein n=1 Tax=Brenneria nigrifluens DSM 30175 = ATCC 13028 TaxID=1121120 RepID=A0A2U1USY5_9GAMM|nr:MULTISPECIES: FeoC-like transcriptional regulator [Brenneria]EHD21743.1 protein of unknown function DUF1920 [Brenneria sp. EniD312]PWC24722.1 hypothetical protein DDT54_07235 [Brenneria nigrifluens DSM 30175 = ATCC 13028]QCR04854.1 hypothetical protein EH206_12090 [Brenneria nigrifluens DSM 30175 = ATCC 13028]
MSLIELRDYVRQQKRSSLQDISRAFRADPGVIEGMLAVWVQKGKIRFHQAEVGETCSCDKSLGSIMSGPTARFAHPNGRASACRSGEAVSVPPLAAGNRFHTACWQRRRRSAIRRC